MSPSRIVLVSSTGEVLCEGESVLASPPEDERETPPPAPGDAYEEPCPPTKRSPGSGVYRYLAPRAA